MIVPWDMSTGEISEAILEGEVDAEYGFFLLDHLRAIRGEEGKDAGQAA
jgi:hypothetical protein